MFNMLLKYVYKVILWVFLGYMLKKIHDMGYVFD